MSLDTVKPKGMLIEIYDRLSHLLIALRFNAVRKLDFVREAQRVDQA